MNFILLRGLVRDGRHWWDFPQRLQAAFPTSRIVLLDLPGVGDQYREASPVTVSGIREHVAARFARIRAELPNEHAREPWCLIAVSLGAMVGMNWAAHDPELFARVILVNTSAKDVGHTGQRFNLRFAPQVFGSILDFRPERYEELILRITTNREDFQGGDRLKQLVAWQKEKPITRQTFWRQILAGSSARLPAKLPQPTLICVSKRDRLVSAECSRRIAKRFGARLETHPTAGHDLALDDPDWLVSRVTDFVSSSKS